MVTLEGDSLFIIDGPQRIELFPQSPAKFFDLVEGNSVEFVAAADGTPSHMLIGGQLKAVRLADVMPPPFFRHSASRTMGLTLPRKAWSNVANVN